MRKFQKDVEMIYKVEQLEKGDDFFVPIDKNKGERDVFLLSTSHLPKQIRENFAYKKYPVSKEFFIVENKNNNGYDLKGKESGVVVSFSIEQLKKCVASHIKEKWKING